MAGCLSVFIMHITRACFRANGILLADSRKETFSNKVSAAYLHVLLTDIHCTPLVAMQQNTDHYGVWLCNFAKCVKWPRLRQRYSCCWTKSINKKSYNSTFYLVCRTICCKLRFTNYISTIQPQGLLNVTIPYQSLSHINHRACLNKTIQRLSRRRTWTFMFQSGS